MKSIAFLAAALLLILPFAFADIGPGPHPEQPIYVTVTVLSNGTPYGGEVTVTYLCANATVRGTEAKNPVEPVDLLIECTEGICASDWYYKLNPCYESKGRFEADTGAETLSSPEVSVESPGSYEFTFDVATGGFNASPQNPAPPPPSQPITTFGCCSSTMLLALIGGALYAHARM